MSSELAPNARTRRPKAIHYLRDAEYRRRLEAGEERFAAWATVCTDPNIGLLDWRGQISIHRAAVMRTLVRHLRLMAPDSGEMARAQAELDAAAVSREMVGVVIEVARGKFEKPDHAAVKLKGAMSALKIVGIGADKQTRVTTNVGVGVTLGDVLRTPLGR